MKRIFAILLVLMIMVTPLVASAADATVPEEVVEGDNSTIVEEVPTEGEISPPIEDEVDFDEVQKTISETLVDWITPHLEEISVIITLLLTLVYNIRRNRALDKSVIKLNNNAVSVAENSSSFISKALSDIEGVSGTVTEYKTEIAMLLDAFRNTAEDRARLENELLEIHKALKLAKEANIEFSNELADLIALANIPNYKKEEMGARHLAAVNAIVEAETVIEEVKEDVGEEA